MTSEGHLVDKGAVWMQKYYVGREVGEAYSQTGFVFLK